MSPSSQSVSPPSETGSQESIDGGTVGRYEICMIVHQTISQLLNHFEILLHIYLYMAVYESSVLMLGFSNWVLQEGSRWFVANFYILTISF